MMASSVILFVLGSLVLGANCQGSTWPPMFHPGEECLEYDGSKVPDCRELINPITKEPYYHPHSFNCSRFWECGPTYETCLFACAHCNNEEMNNPLCKGQQALTFDPTIQWPFGPVCDWPSTIDCDNDGVPCDCLPWQSCVNGLCSPQCTADIHCPAGYVCDECNWCVEGEAPSCNGDDSACLQGVCDVPLPYTTCEYCGDGDLCLPGCSSDSNCPSNYPVCGGGGDHLCGCTADDQCPSGYVCDTGAHECREDMGCANNDLNCLQNQCDEPANWPYTTCEYCDDVGGVECFPGCSDDSLCPPDYPVCGHGGTLHRCGCNDDGDCAGLGSSYTCDVDNHQCKAGCDGDADCPNDMCDIENSPYTTCTHCDNNLCVPGCTSDDYCPTGFTCVDYICEVAPAGFVLLTEIKVSGAGAGTYTMDLVGNHGTAHPATCITNTLSGSGTFTGDSQLGEVLKHGCFRAPLNAEVSAGTVIGGESWTGATACFDWNDDEYFVSICSISGGLLVDCNNEDGLSQC